ncbi:MAG: hypothetical protein AB7U98_11110 [Candidatus Nitrosocosmicus sp.]
MLSIEKDLTKKKNRKELTIELILQYRENKGDFSKEERIDLRLYRDILRFIICQDSVKSPDISEIDGIKLRETFKSRVLCNWLLDNNVDLIDDFRGSPIAKTYRAHTIDARISNRIQKLIDLGLIEMDDEAIDSERGNSKTHQYVVTRSGILISSLLNLQKYEKDSDEYVKNLQFVLNRFLEYLPYTYKNSENYYFHFLKDIFQNCFNRFQDILFYFFNLMLQYQHSLAINFSVIRIKLNESLYRNIIEETEFKQIFYKSLAEFNTPFWLRGLKDKEIDESLIYEEKTKAQYLIRAQFKLDVEAQIDKEISEVLKINTDITKSFQLATKLKRRFSEKDVFEKGLYEQIQEQHVLDYAIRTKWEIERNSNLSNSSCITIIVKCQTCGFISPYSIEMEKESFNQVTCINCKENGGITSYD